MKKMSFFMGMIAFLSLTTSCEQDTLDESTILIKSAFNAEETYWSILENTVNGLDEFDALSNSQKQAVWAFKYERYLSENDLNTEQQAVINQVQDYLTEFNFDEPNLMEDEVVEIIIRSVFNENESDFLIMTLENFPSDVNGGDNTVTNGCWFCWRGIPGTETPCEAVVINGEYTGDFAFTVQVRRHGIFGIPRGPIETAVLPC